MSKFIKYILISSCLLYFNVANSALIIENWNLTDHSLTFDLSGTVDFVGDNDTDSFFIGPADSFSVNWINTNDFNGGFTVNGGDYNISNVGVYSTNTYGSYVYTNRSPFGSILVGEQIDISFSFSGLNMFNAAAMDGQTLFVSAGYCDVPLPDVQCATGGDTPVTEPSIIALFAAGLFGIGFVRRRQS